MSDEDEDFSSDESSAIDDLYKKTQNSNVNKNTLGLLTLEDNDDDSNLYQRPDLIVEYEDGGEDESEFEGEDEDDFSSVGGSRRRTKKSSLNKSKSTRNSEFGDQKKKKKKKSNRCIGLCVTATKYECVRRVGRKLGFKEVEENEDWTLFWTDTSVSIDRVNQMKRWQKINHFPGMSEICRKDFLTRNMNRMLKLYPKDYTFYPKAWCLPADYADLINYARLKKNKTYICKPDSGCQGKGIFITKNPNKDIKPGDNYVAQVYVSRPFVVDGFKFDLRVYVAVTSCDPFRVFVYKEGLARFTTQPYEEPTHGNCKDVFMHLTNYAIQKRSDEFIRDEETGTKRRISTINKWLRERGYDVDKLWADIDDVIIKVLFSAHAVLKHNYRTCFANHYKGSACFEILGYDILIDKKLKPYVLEVNHSPSFTTDSKLDKEIKDALIYDTIMLLNIGAMDKRRCVEEERKRVRERLFLKQGKKETKEELDEVLQEWLKQIEKWEDKHMGNFRRVYPAPGTEKYDRFYNNTGTLFSETAASRARIEQAKQQMVEVSRKNEKFIGANNNNKNQNRFQNKESRGESPIRKTSTNSSLPTKNSTSNLNSLVNNTINSIPNTPGNNSKINFGYTNVNNNNSNSKLQQIPRNGNIMPLSNNTINIDISNISNGNLKKLDRPNSNTKNSPNGLQQMNAIATINKQQLPIPLSAPQSAKETWRPIEINELDEMERIQSLKHRENLIKGMGITDFVNRILYGTPGTVATMPPSFISNHHNLRHQNQDNQSMDALHRNGINNASYNTKFEIKTKNYNPFENHSLFAEKYINNQSMRSNLSTNGYRNLKTNNNVNTNHTTNNNNLNNTTTNNSNIINVVNRSKFMNPESASSSTTATTINTNTTFHNSNNANYNSSNYRYQLSIANNQNESANIRNNDHNPSSSNQKYIHLSNSSNNQSSNNVMNGNNQKMITNNNSNSINDTNKTKSTRFPIELFSKNEINNQQATKLLNSYRIRSAQNLAKQRTTGLYIFSYNRTKTVPE